MAGITLEAVTKIFPGTTVAAVEDLDLTIEDGEFVVLVGPSGSGKTTALRMIAGLEEMTHGRIRVGDRTIGNSPPRTRDMAMVFQNYALYPHMTVRDNMGFGLKMKRVSKQQRNERVERVAAMLDMSELLGRKPKELSGGQRQRVAMGRAIVREPAAFLMDEPLSNLDAKLRVQMRAEIANLQRRVSTTTIYVTHDQTEAMTMGDRVAVLHQGKLLQVDSPQELYRRPSNLFVASFIGSPAMNSMPAEVERCGEGISLRLAGQSLTLPRDSMARFPHLSVQPGAEVVVGIRPEDMQDPSFESRGDAGQTLEMRVERTEMLGAEIIAYMCLCEPDLKGRRAHAEATRPLGAEQHQDRNDLPAIFTARLDPRSVFKRNQIVKVSVAVDRIYLFDPATGRSLG